jgi:L-fuconolactonase
VSDAAPGHPAAPATPIVDTHVHVVADDPERYPLRPLDPEARWFRDAPCTVERFRALMDEQGVAHACLVQAMGAYTDDNSYTVDAAATDPARFTAIVYVDLARDPVAALDRWVARGARGVRIVAGTPHRPARLDGAEARAVVRHAHEQGLRIIVSTLADGLPDLGRLLEVEPDIALDLDHCGFADLDGGYPYRRAGDLFALAAHPGVVCKVSTIALDRARRADGDPRRFVDLLAERFGTDRVMWASNFSQTDHRPYGATLELARAASAGLGPAAQAAFLGANATTRYGLTTA